MLRMAVPGNPGEDYPIYAEVPDTSFTCEGRVEGGYYADTEAECQPFHVCSADRDGGLAKNSFLCPNGTLFNQENFVCEYWFNVDSSQAESFYGLNDNIGTVEQGEGLDGAASSPAGGYASPPSSPAGSPSGGYASPPSSPAASPAGGYASPPSVPSASLSGAYFAPSSAASSSSGEYESPSSSSAASLAGGYAAPASSSYQSSRSERRQGRLFSTVRRNSESARETKSKNSNSRFVNFPINLKNPKTSKIIDELNKESRKSKNLNSNKPRPSVIDGKVKGRRPFNERKQIQGAPLSSNIVGTQRNSKQTTQIRTQPQFRKPDKIRIPTAPSAKKRTNKSSRRRQPQKQKEARKGRTEVLTGYLPPIDNSYTAGDAALAASSPDYDYEEAPLPTYTGASDTAGQSSYVAPVADTGYAAGSADTSYEAPADSDDNVDALADSVYEEEPLPTYNRGSADSGTSYNAPSADSGTSYNAPIADSVYESSLPGSNYQEDILPAYNNGVYNDADSEGSSYTAPSADSYGAPADPVIEENISEESDYEEDVLPQYNNGVYNSGSESSPTSGTSYTAPTSDDYAPPTLDNSDYEEDILPQYNNGVYNNGGSVGGSSYTAPRDNTAPATGYSPPVLGSYQDPGADILPEYFKSEITLGLNNREDVPRVEPFLSDYGAPAGDSYRVAGSSPVAAVVKTPDLTYGVP